MFMRDLIPPAILVVAFVICVILQSPAGRRRKLHL